MLKKIFLFILVTIVWAPSSLTRQLTLGERSAIESDIDAKVAGEPLPLWTPVLAPFKDFTFINSLAFKQPREIIHLLEEVYKNKKATIKKNKELNNFYQQLKKYQNQFLRYYEEESCRYNSQLHQHKNLQKITYDSHFDDVRHVLSSYHMAIQMFLDLVSHSKSSDERKELFKLLQYFLQDLQKQSENKNLVI